MKNIKKLKITLIDGYLDEPSCLGVPPYISPHIRYLYGALIAAGSKQENISYQTIDQIRNKRATMLEKMEGSDLIIIMAGTTVPGKYLGGQPITIKEIQQITAGLNHPRKILGGPLTLIKNKLSNFNFDYICEEIAAPDIYQFLTDCKIPHTEIPAHIGRWAVIGAKLTRLHPDYPHLICELETFRGCPRQQHCSFCSEHLKKITYQRQPAAIIQEVKALGRAGNHYYRLGCQTDILLFQAKQIKGKPSPNPEALKTLYTGIRKADPQLKVLHLDNMNPAVIIKYERECRQILETITTHNTPGDTAAFGLESADPLVLAKNNIASNSQTTLQAIKILNEIGGQRENGLPRLLPGINFLHGLIGERKKTLDYNYQFLKKVFDNKLMLRRINIRQVLRLGNYPEIKYNQYQFKNYKQKINKKINKPMLQRVFPQGTILQNVFTETHQGKLTYGRQRGTYPILIGIPGNLPLKKYITVRVIDHGYRSLTALPWPFYVNKASIEQLKTIPGIGDYKAQQIFLKQPQTVRELKKNLEPDFPFSRWQDWFYFDNF